MVDENQDRRAADQQNGFEGDEPSPDNHNKFTTFVGNFKTFFNKDRLLANIKNPKEFLGNLRSRPKLFFSILGGVGIVVLIVVGTILASFFAHEEHYEEKLGKNTQDQIHKLVRAKTGEGVVLDNLPTLRDNNSHIPLSNEEEVNALIQKADILYNHGNTEEALKIFSDISLTSSSIANHNLGVIRMCKHDYIGALKAFDNALASKSDASVNAINAMATAFYLNNMDLYTRYLRTAQTHVQELKDQPIYSYVYALTLYYGGHYFETLSALTNPQSNLFKTNRLRLAAKMYLLFGDEVHAAEYLSAIATPEDKKALGLLYARLGDYDQAIQNLQDYAISHPEDDESFLALELIALKMGDFSGAHNLLGVLLRNINKNPQKEKILTDTYRLEPVLNHHFFDINTIRKGFWETNFGEGLGLPIERVLFYYAPYRLIDVKNALGSIQKGVFFVDSSGKQDFDGAANFLEHGKDVSVGDQHMIAGIRHLKFSHLRLALKEFKLSLEANPNSSMAHYNTGLIYAQLDNFHDASFHFMKAYRLNPHNVLAGALGVLAMRLDYRNPKTFLKQVTTGFDAQQFSNKTNQAFLSSLIAYLNDAPNDDLTWIRGAKQPLAIYYALGVAYANRAKDKQRLAQNFAALKKMYPNNMLTNVFYEIALKYRANIRQMLGVYAFLTNKKTNFEELIHGPLLARKMYIYMGSVTGLLNHEEEELNTRLSASNNQEMSTDLLRMLGLLHIFQKQYEKSVGIYNFLIDKIGDHEMEVYELASVAYIALKRFDNAALLLEIGKTMDPDNYEVRYGLGLLYQRVGNLKASLSNFGAIKSHDFHSYYFDFLLNTPTNAQDFP
ncbi:tetratricopeptide repeat protein [Helicobacter ailurogastricus]|uniref:tetratricopeptide repeat protein n=1 Tax=Helicobacter ailurogastricus TaxID=1578720 RepID=UPI00244D884B|nr:tetratricopeptide repeat protein [Helicobacter ailurogastricus]GMB91486.1 Anaphase-promoting protein [Helicobacter ailurogastricus]